jgi:SNF2 family DNA or RNA helicase
LIIVPTSCIVNWETELKKFCPVFKVLTYFGSQKRRKFLRNGWSKLNSFHICITSYQIVVQDSNAFRRKRWYYMILDEAHNIKNFKSKRWQTLLNFNTQRRLLLTGTPLQNNLMELWSLMHFLMPHIFRSRKEFSYWFSNPLSGMVEGNRSVNNDLISRLHSIMRPFLLRRLKKDVAKQLPGKFEHIVMCRLSKRQLHLYEEYMSRTTTKSSLTGGGYLGMMNILMQLRKVCNHPDLFEPRPISSPFVPATVSYRLPSIAVRAGERGPLETASPHLMQFWNHGCDSLATTRMLELAVKKHAFVEVQDVSLPQWPVPAGSQFQRYAHQLREVLRQERTTRCEFNFQIMNERCSRPNFPLSWRVVRALMVVPFTTQVVQARHDPRAARYVTPCWFDLIKTVEERATEMSDLIKQFVFVLPSVVSRGVELISSATVSAGDKVVAQHGGDPVRIREVFRTALRPFYPAYIRQRIFFPDRKLIQFDSGKLQTLAVLLRRLKREGHKCLIFTQMSKMLDILEIFLNLHDHTFVRLDGSTSIERRQKLMDRFNSDPKLFCFILSTRSGGLGINLTGADTVIFYDTDWNPAMDAQAQDRAHRIGQTREVHIYRLVSESTVEENILTKARQKRHLDYLVMTEGNFSEASLFSSRGLKDMLGVQGGTGADGADAAESSATPGKGGMSAAEIEAAMAAAEDEDDVRATKAATLEASKELDEFDEQAPIEPAGDDDGAEGGTEGAAGTPTAGASGTAMVVATEDAAADDRDLENEFASWQASVGPDFKSLESALKPIERYAFRIRTVIEPHYSIFYITEQARLEALAASGGEDEAWNVEEIEKEKEEEELRALSEGELLAANVSRRDVSRFKSWFLQERARRVSARRMRTMTGGAWSLLLADGVPYWYNSDTGEARYTTPEVVAEQEKIQYARERGFSAMPVQVMVHIFSYLLPYPERCRVAPLCARWAEAAAHESFIKRVLPVESGARDPTKKLHKLTTNVYASIADALVDALPGDTIQLGMGHHWEGNLLVEKPLRLVCEAGGGGDNSKCIVELTGQVQVTPAARSVVLCGFTLRRPRKVSRATSCVAVKGSSLSVRPPLLTVDANYSCLTLLTFGILQIYNCNISNDGAQGSVISAVACPWVRVAVSQLSNGHAGLHALNSTVVMTESTVSSCLSMCACMTYRKPRLVIGERPRGLCAAPRRQRSDLRGHVPSEQRRGSGALCERRRAGGSPALRDPQQDGAPVRLWLRGRRTRHAARAANMPVRLPVHDR